MKAKAKSVFIKLVSTLGTGFFYSSKKSVRNNSRKLLLKKYDPVMRMHALFKVCPPLALHITMQHHAAPRSTTQHHAAPRSTTQHHAAPRSTTQHHAAPNSTTQHHTAPHNTTAIPHNTTQHNTTQHSQLHSPVNLIIPSSHHFHSRITINHIYYK